jgi:putative protease
MPESRRGISVPRPEILAPAGSWQTLRAAAEGRADAVYFGGRAFNARRTAGNFGDDELPEAVAYCHVRGMRAYLTVNTVIFEREMDDCLALVKKICEAGADGVIVQDLGLIRLLRRAAPHLRLHGSTQMSVHNIDGVRQLADMGLSRVVLARELSLEEIKQISAQSPIELEVFVHGALCMSVSGQCYLSACLGGRSGNRGMCAQPCRLPFAAPGGTGHDLSLRDLSLCGRVGELSRAGVRSLKIEGRLKRPEYVAAASSVYSSEADGLPEDAQLGQLLGDVFSRSGFTQGYFDGARGRSMFGSRGREDVLASQAALKSIKSRFGGREPQRVPVNMVFFAAPDKPASLEVTDGQGRSVQTQGAVPEAARERGTDAEFVKEKLEKTGGTPYFAENIRADIAPGLAMPVSQINALRRQALEELTKLRAAAAPVPFSLPGKEAPEAAPAGKSGARPECRLRLRRAAQLTGAALGCGAQLIFLSLDEAAACTARLSKLTASGAPLGVELPRAVFGDSQAKEVKAALAKVKDAGITDALCGNLGSVRLALEAGMRVHGDFGLNAANGAALSELRSFGLLSCVLSFEQSLADMRAQPPLRDFSRGLIAYGRLPLMLVRCCPLKNGAGCAACAGSAGGLTDRLGQKFPVMCFGGASEIYNSRPLWMCDRAGELGQAGADFAQLYFSTETPDEVAKTLAAWRAGLPPEGDFTRGLYACGSR